MLQVLSKARGQALVAERPPFTINSLSPDALDARIRRTEAAITNAHARMERAHARCKWDLEAQLAAEITAAEHELTEMYARS